MTGPVPLVRLVRTDRRLLLTACLLLLGLRLATLPLYPLIDRTESRYGEIAREMLSTGDWLMPRLHGEPFLAKPPLSTWVQAGSARILGTSEFALRLPAWLAGLATLLAVMGAAGCVGGRGAGRRAGFVFVTCPLAVLMAGALMADPYLGLGTALAIWGVVGWLQAPPGSRAAHRSAFLLLPAGLATSVLSKGLVVLLPLGAAYLALLGSTEGRAAIRRFPHVRVLGFSALLCLPWFWMAEQAHPGYCRYFFVGEHYERFVNAKWTGDRYGGTHPRPLGTIWVFFALGILPWCGQAWRVTRRKCRQRLAGLGVSRHVLHALLGMAFAPILLFTFAGSVLPTYPYPSLIALAVLLGVAAPVLDLQRSPARVAQRDHAVLQCAGIGMGAFLVFLLIVPGSWVVHGSQREVVANTGAKRLLYARDIRYLYSAHFYSGGRAVGVRSKVDEPWDRLRADPGAWLVVVEGIEYKRIPGDILARLTFEKRVGSLYRVFSVARDGDSG